MENFDYYDHTRDLTFHKIIVKENPREQSYEDNEIISILKSWKTPSIVEYLLCGNNSYTLGDFFCELVLDNTDVESSLYCVFDGKSQEVIGTTLLVPDYRITHRDVLAKALKARLITEALPHLTETLKKYVPSTDLTTEQLFTLLDDNAKGLLVSGLCVNPNQSPTKPNGDKNMFGDRIIKSIINNPIYFNGVQPLCIMGNVDKSNTPSNNLLQRNEFYKLHNPAPNGFNSYYKFEDMHMCMELGI